MPERLQLHPSLAGVPIRVGWRWLIVAAAVTAITAHELAPELGEISDALAWYGRVSVVIVAIVSLGLHELAHVLGGAADLRSNARDRAGHVWRAVRHVFCAQRSTGGSASQGRWRACCWPPCSAAAPGPARAASTRRTDVCLFLALANGALALVNLIPGYPLDGGRLLRALVWYLSDDLVVGTRVAAFYGQIVLVVGLFGGFVMLAAGQPYSVWGAWLTLAVWAVSGAARDGVARVIWREAGRRVSVEEAGLATSQASTPTRPSTRPSTRFCN